MFGTHSKQEPVPVHVHVSECAGQWIDRVLARTLVRSAGDTGRIRPLEYSGEFTATPGFNLSRKAWIRAGELRGRRRAADRDTDEGSVGL
jgi:hypothetical protein